jgi:hypothetical protein
MAAKLQGFSNKYVEEMLEHHTKEGIAEKCDPFMKSIYNFKKGNKSKVRAMIHPNPEDPTDVFAVHQVYEKALG